MLEIQTIVYLFVLFYNLHAEPLSDITEIEEILVELVAETTIYCSDKIKELMKIKENGEQIIGILSLKHEDSIENKNEELQQIFAAFDDTFNNVGVNVTDCLNYHKNIYKIYGEAILDDLNTCFNKIKTFREAIQIIKNELLLKFQHVTELREEFYSCASVNDDDCYDFVSFDIDEVIEELPDFKDEVEYSMSLMDEFVEEIIKCYETTIQDSKYEMDVRLVAGKIQEDCLDNIAEIEVVVDHADEL